jgi:hypothetical protein
LDAFFSNLIHQILKEPNISVYPSKNSIEFQSHNWSRAGDWMLPFRGTAEYAPELNIWLGPSVYSGFLCTADLSAVVRGQPPEQSLIWEDTHLPEDWFPRAILRLVSLGCGRFCIARFFNKMVPCKADKDELLPVNQFTVLTGLEVLARKGKGDGSGEGNGSGRLRMVKHKSRRFNCSDTGSVASLF